MGINFCGLRRRIRPNGSSETQKDGATSPLMKPGCLWGAMRVKKRPLISPETWPEMKMVITLEYLIASSPGLNVNNMSTSSGGETPMHKQSSRRIHPSFDGEALLEPGAKPKKRVRFRSPVVADVFVLRRSPGEAAAVDE